MVMASVHKEEEKRDDVFYSQLPSQFAGTASGETDSEWSRSPGLPRWGLEAGPKAWSRTSDVPEMLPMGVPPFLLPPNGLLQQATRRFRRGVRQRAPPSNTSSVAPQSRCSPTRAVE